MKKRFLAVLLATAMATTMIVGCGDQNRSNYEDDEDDDDDEDDEDDEDEDDEDDDDVDVVVEYDDMFAVSPDSILYDTDIDIRVLYGEYVVDGEDFYDPGYYKQFEENVRETMELEDPYWGDTATVYSMLQKIEVGKFSEFWGNIYYDDREGGYITYSGEGRYTLGKLRQEDLRVEKEMLLNQYGADGITYYDNMMESYNLDYAVLDFPVKGSSYTLSIGTVVEAEGNKLHFYDYEYNEDKTVTILDEVFSCRFDFKGAKLEISKNDVVFELVPYDFRESHYCQYIYNGPSFVDNKGAALDDLCGLAIADDGDQGLYVSHGYFVDGSESFSDYERQIFEYDIENGRFRLTYAPTYIMNGDRWTFDDSPAYKSVSGQFVWGGSDHGLVMKVDGQMYYYQSSQEEYYYDVFGYNGISDDSDSGSSNGALASSLNIHEQVSNDLSEAFGDDAVVDENSGAITMDNNILFGVDSAEISEEGKAYLDDFIVTYVTAIKPYLDDGSVTSIVIEGHTDTDGSYEYNLDLSERRAQAVADYVIERQPELADCTVTVGYSYLYPIYDENGNVDKAASRRVVFSFRTQ